MKKTIAKILRKIIPLRYYKLIANGVIIAPAYYKDIIDEAETNFDFSREDTDDRAILLMRKYGHILDKGLHRPDVSPGHSFSTYNELKVLVERLEKTASANDSTVSWAREKLTCYEKLQREKCFKHLQGETPSATITFAQFENLVHARRSNRLFLNQPIDDKTISMLKNLANWASSSCNKQPIEIYATSDTNLTKKCLKCCKGGTGFGENIPSFWVFTANVRGYVWPSEIMLPYVDTCLGVQNVMLGATTLGISGTLLSWAQKNKEEEQTLKKLLGIPPHHQIVICAVMGYARETFLTPIRKDV